MKIVFQKIVFFFKNLINVIKTFDSDLTGLTLNFVRNLITIEDSDESQVLVVCYADSGMARLIQYIASAADLDEWHLHATEIFSGLLKEKGIVSLILLVIMHDLFLLLW